MVDEEEKEEEEEEKEIFQSNTEFRKWLSTRGKEKYIDFEDSQLRKLRNYFNSLDDDESGYIGVEELETPLIALGLVDNRQQV